MEGRKIGSPAFFQPSILPLKKNEKEVLKLILLIYFPAFLDLSSRITPLNRSLVGEFEALEITSTVRSCRSYFSFVLKVSSIMADSLCLIG